MSAPTDDVLVRELRARAEAEAPQMALSAAAVRAAGRHRRLGQRIATGVGAVAVVGAVTLGLSTSSWLGTPVSPAGTTPGGVAAPALGLRLVSTETSGACTEPPLVADGPGRACDLAGDTTYDLGERLGLVHVDSWSAEPGSALVDLTLDKAGRATLEDVTNEVVGQRMAILLDGRVVAAATVMSVLPTASFELSTSSAAEAEKITEALDTAAAPPQERGHQRHHPAGCDPTVPLWAVNPPG